MIPRYRAYNGITNKIYDVLAIDFENNKISVSKELVDGRSEATTYYKQTFDDLDKFILIQSTGLFDKNGIEIFEGDILKRFAGSTKDENDQIALVLWDHDSWAIEFNIKDMPWAYYRSMRNAIAVDEEYGIITEIIGNKYEHSHLLLEQEHD